MELVKSNGNNKFPKGGLLSDENAGVQGASTLSVKEFGDGKHIITEITLTDFVVGALAGAAADLAVGSLLYEHPTGQHLKIASALSALSLTAAGTAVNTDLGLGSVVATGAVAVLSGTATFEDVLTGQTVATAAAGGAAVSVIANPTAGVQTGIALNGTTSEKSLYLNAAGTWNADNTGNLTASGKIILIWDHIS